MPSQETTTLTYLLVCILWIILSLFVSGLNSGQILASFRTFRASALSSQVMPASAHSVPVHATNRLCASFRTFRARAQLQPSPHFQCKAAPMRACLFNGEENEDLGLRWKPSGQAGKASVAFKPLLWHCKRYCVINRIKVKNFNPEEHR